MKKIIAFILSAVIISALCLCASATATEYPMFSSSGMSEGVTLYIDGNEVDASRVQNVLGKTWSANILGAGADGSDQDIKIIIWSKGGHMHFDGARLCAGSSVKIVFTGTAIALRTNYREEGQGNWAEPTVKVDGTAVESIYNTFGTSIAENKAFVDVKNLENKCHTLELVANGDVEFDVIEIEGVLGNHEEQGSDASGEESGEQGGDIPSVPTFDGIIAVAAVAVIAGTCIVVSSKRK
ncbi:MAG: hypothetical protein IKS28_03605 [Clostridia bacterium]|nr:hypothetical protein [Clostridia bacterium]